MKYKINDTVEIKANSVTELGTILNVEDKMYSIEFPGGKVIKCTEHYFTCLLYTSPSPRD
mgnify:CR=1 FL=1